MRETGLKAKNSSHQAVLRNLYFAVQLLPSPHLHLLKDILPCRYGPGLEQHVTEAEVDVVAPHRSHTEVDGRTQDPAPQPCLHCMRQRLPDVVGEHPHDEIVLPHVLLEQQPQPLLLGHVPQGGPRGQPVTEFTAGVQAALPSIPMLLETFRKTHAGTDSFAATRTTTWMHYDTSDPMDSSPRGQGVEI